MKTEKQIIEGLKEGSYRDFSILYTQYADLLYGFTLNLIKSPGEAKDVVQETFYRIWKNRKEISSDLSFKSYLYTIAKNMIIDSFRKKIENVSFKNFVCSDAFLDYCENETENKLDFDEFQIKLENAKKKLTKRQKEIFELCKEYGYKNSKVAQTLNISEKSVKNQLSLALHIIRIELSEYQPIILFILFLARLNKMYML